MTADGQTDLCAVTDTTGFTRWPNEQPLKWHMQEESLSHLAIDDNVRTIVQCRVAVAILYILHNKAVTVEVWPKVLSFSL